MRLVIQRVSSARVLVGGEEFSSIKRGLFVLLGIGRDDTFKDWEYSKKRILNVKYFDAAPSSRPGDSASPYQNLWTHSVVEHNLEILLVSQFTLYARINKGTRPDFHEAMLPNQSKAFFDRCLEDLRNAYQADRVASGMFGNKMACELVNDGPVTVAIDTAIMMKNRMPRRREEEGENPENAARDAQVADRLSEAAKHGTN